MSNSEEQEWCGWRNPLLFWTPKLSSFLPLFGFPDAPIVASSLVPRCDLTADFSRARHRSVVAVIPYIMPPKKAYCAPSAVNMAD